MGLFSKPRPESHQVLGRDFTCTVCGHDLFHKREAQLHSQGASFFNLEWTGPTTLCLVCDQCGYIHWFKPQD